MANGCKPSTIPPPLSPPQTDRSLQRMKTDYIDIMQLHSPSYDDLMNGDGIEGLKKAQEQGKIRDVSLSADDDAAVQAVEMGEFDTLQISYKLLESEPSSIIRAAREKDMGIIIKEPLAQVAYEQPRPEGKADRWERAQKRLAPEVIGDLPRVEANLRWLLNDTDVHTAIVGTTNLEHLKDNIASAQLGPLPDDVYAAISAVG